MNSGVVLWMRWRELETPSAERDGSEHVLRDGIVASIDGAPPYATAKNCLQIDRANCHCDNARVGIVRRVKPQIWSYTIP
jgi:hypothetical protein